MRARALNAHAELLELCYIRFIITKTKPKTKLTVGIRLVRILTLDPGYLC